MLTSFRTVVVVLLAAGAVASCGDGKAGGAPTTPTAPAPAINITLTFAPGQTTVVAETPLSVTFERVSEDSRCPATANCITAGQAVVQMVVRDPTRSPNTNVNLATVPGRDTAEVSGYELKLEGVTPYPMQSVSEIAPGDYRASLRIIHR